MASLHAVRAGARVVLLEGTADGGRKILISGGGRCNILPSVLEPGRFVSLGTASPGASAARRLAPAGAARLLRTGPRHPARPGGRERQALSCLQPGTGCPRLPGAPGPCRGRRLPLRAPGDRGAPRGRTLDRPHDRGPGTRCARGHRDHRRSFRAGHRERWLRPGARAGAGAQRGADLSRAHTPPRRPAGSRRARWAVARGDAGGAIGPAARPGDGWVPVHPPGVQRAGGARCLPRRGAVEGLVSPGEDPGAVGRLGSGGLGGEPRPAGVPGR